MGNLELGPFDEEHCRCCGGAPESGGLCEDCQMCRLCCWFHAAQLDDPGWAERALCGEEAE